MLQEILLENTINIYYGAAILLWSELTTLVKDHPLGHARQLWWLDKTLSNHTWQSGTGTLFINTKPCWQSECSDPRDKVYALQGLLRFDQMVTVDYSKSLVEVFLDAAVTVIRYESSERRDICAHRILHLDLSMAAVRSMRWNLFEMLSALSSSKDS
jgi:hypothetical protein